MQRYQVLSDARARVRQFQRPFAKYQKWSDIARPTLQAKVEALHRACQAFATTEIESLTAELNFDFRGLDARCSLD